ncbi:MAG: endopeptidase La [Desulforegulaceae bacterium]|nr:endopeptidase La [Desulforegulaceae bacterium]
MISFSKLFKSGVNNSGRLVLPVLPLRDTVVFPGMVAPLFVGRKKSIEALSKAMETSRSIFLALQENPRADEPEIDEFYETGVVGKVLQLLKLPDNSVKVLVEGQIRAKVYNYIEEENCLNAELGQVFEESPAEAEFEAVKRQLLLKLDSYLLYNKKISKEILENISKVEDPFSFSDVLASKLPLKLQSKHLLLEERDSGKRLYFLLDYLAKELEVAKVEEKIKGRVKKQIDKTQKNYYLNEQIRAIKKEMGAGDEGNDEIEELKKKIGEKSLPEEVEAKVEKELKKFALMSPMSAEANVVRTYIDWIIELPWSKKSEVNNDLKKAESILEEDHYGLDKPKERILEYLAVQGLSKSTKGPILCFVGPPGVGKTSLAKSIARATGREYVRISLGGVRDEAEIRGHRRTYVGAMPGKIIQAIKKSGKVNPLICLDEVDKMSMDFRGDPSSALLEVLDPEQNFSFNDHYLDLDYDLSQVFFLTTANFLNDIPVPLQDRMEIIQISGYTELEKLEIAKNHLFAKQLEANGFSEEDITLSDNSLLMLIRNYTREAGVRNLERKIAGVLRKTAKIMLLEDKVPPFNITKNTIKKYFGSEKFTYSLAEKKDLVGVATGLAWTQTGGDILSIETAVMPGKGNVTVTGKLGEVMQESAKAAMSYARSKSSVLGINSEFYSDNDIHIHVPEGATPKDGPSAGITICTSIVSAITGKPVKRDLGMTGEITLRGRVLSIGGLREKSIAAHRSGIKTILFPKENEKDLKDIPKSVLSGIKFFPVSHMDEVLSHSLLEIEKD